MDLLEHNGSVYKILEWRKPEDTDYAVGECCYGIYAAEYGDGPYMIVANGDKNFHPLYFEFKNGNPQPLYVLSIPAIRERDLVKMPEYYSLVGDARNKDHKS